MLPFRQAQLIVGPMQCYLHYGQYAPKAKDKMVGTLALLVMNNAIHVGAPLESWRTLPWIPACHKQGMGKTIMCDTEKRCYEKWVFYPRT
jgi:hypothetical protein